MEEWKQNLFMYQLITTLLTSKKNAIIAHMLILVPSQLLLGVLAVSLLVFPQEGEDYINFGNVFHPRNCLPASPFLRWFPCCGVAAFPPSNVDLGLADGFHLTNERPTPPCSMDKSHKVSWFRELQKSKGNALLKFE